MSNNIIDATGNGSGLKIDPIDNAAVVITERDANIHAGENFQYGDRFILGPGSTEFFAQTTNSKSVHFNALDINMDTADNINISFQEGMVISGGTVGSIYNNNRMSSILPTSQVTKFPAVTDSGTELFPTAIFSSNKERAGIMVSRVPWILSSDTVYGIKLKNQGNAAVSGIVNIGWYEK